MRQYRSPRWLRAGLAAAFILGLAGTAAIGMANTTTNLTLDEGNFGNEVTAPKSLEIPPSPLLTGEQVALSDLAKKVSFHVYLPDDPLASASLVSGAWVVPDGSMLAIAYSSGALIYEQPESIGVPVPTPGPGETYGEKYGEQSNDAPKDFAELARRLADQDARDFGVNAADERGTVKGTPSFQVQYVPDANFGYVEFSYGGVRIAMKGLYDVEILTRIADSMQ